MNMSTKLTIVAAYVLIVAVVVFKVGFDSRNYLLVILGLIALAVEVILFRVRRRIRRARR